MSIAFAAPMLEAESAPLPLALPAPTAVEAPAPADLATWAVEGPEHRGDRFDLATWLDHQALVYLMLQSHAGDLVSRMLRELADQVRMVKASTVAQYQDRLDCWVDARAAGFSH